MHTVTRRNISNNENGLSVIALSFSDGAELAIEVPTRHITEHSWIGAIKLASDRNDAARKALGYNLGIALESRGGRGGYHHGGSRRAALGDINAVR